MKVKLTFSHDDILEGIRMMMAAKGVPAVLLEDVKIERKDRHSSWTSMTHLDGELRVIAEFETEAYSSSNVVASQNVDAERSSPDSPERLRNTRPSKAV